MFFNRPGMISKILAERANNVCKGFALFIQSLKFADILKQPICHKMNFCL